MKRTSRISLLSIFIIVVSLAGILWPLMRRGFYISDDGEWMVIRLSAFYQSLADGQFPVRFLGRLNNSYGYPVANFLYPGFLYIGSILHFFGLSFVTSVKVILVASVIGGSAWVYASLRRIYSVFASTLGTLAFIGSPYLLYDLYTRGSVGEILAFLPASMGMYSIVADKPWLFAIAVGGLIVSHNTLALLFLGVFVVFIITLGRWGFLRQLLLGMGLAAFFWVPAIVEKQYVRFDTITVSNPMEYTIGLRTLWLTGLAGVLAGIFFLFGKVKKHEKITSIAFALNTISLFFVLPISAFFWSIRPVASLVQFPYRMLAVAALMTPWIVASVGEKFIRQKIIITGIVLVILVLPAWYQLQKISFVMREEGYYTTNEGTSTVADEYMPKWVSVIPDNRAPERIIFQNGRGTVVYEYLNTQKVVAHVDASEESLLRLQNVYYPGWGVTVDGKLVPVTYQNSNGFMEVSVSAGKHTVEAEFRETVMRFLADMVSVISIIIWFIILLKDRKYQIK